MRDTTLRRGDVRDWEVWRERKLLAEILMSKVCEQLPRGISSMDIDQCIETRDNFLFYEFKGSPFGELPTGERRTFEAFFRTLRTRLTIFLVEHEPKQFIDPDFDLRRMSIGMWWLTKPVWTPFFELKEWELGRWTNDWFAYAEQRRSTFFTAYCERAGIYK